MKPINAILHFNGKSSSTKENCKIICFVENGIYITTDEGCVNFVDKDCDYETLEIIDKEYHND